VRFLVDAQLPPGLARMLSDHGHVAEHVFEIGMAEATDRDIWRYALDHVAVIITKDEDFPGMLALSAKHRPSCGSGWGTPGAGHCSTGLNLSLEPLSRWSKPETD
jgi:predicted nuclease of predicted toxin-antitoxin system